MPKITEKTLEVILVRFYKEDLDVLRRLYSGHFGLNKAIRTIVHSFVTQTSANATKAIDNNETNAGANAGAQEDEEPFDLSKFLPPSAPPV